MEPLDRGSSRAKNDAPDAPVTGRSFSFVRVPLFFWACLWEGGLERGKALCEDVKEKQKTDGPPTHEAAKKKPAPNPHGVFPKRKEGREETRPKRHKL